MFNEYDKLYAVLDGSQALCFEPGMLLTYIERHFRKVLLSVDADFAIRGCHVVANIQFLMDNFKSKLLKMSDNLFDRMGFFSGINVNHAQRSAPGTVGPVSFLL